MSQSLHPAVLATGVTEETGRVVPIEPVEKTKVFSRVLLFNNNPLGEVSPRSTPLRRLASKHPVKNQFIVLHEGLRSHRDADTKTPSQFTKRYVR